MEIQKVFSAVFDKDYMSGFNTINKIPILC